MPLRRCSPVRLTPPSSNHHRLQHLGVEQITEAGNELDQFAPVVAESAPDLPDALKQTILADMDVRPDRLHQFVLAQHALGVGCEERQHGKCFRPKLDGFAVASTQLAALLVELKTRKTQHHAFPRKFRANEISKKFQTKGAETSISGKFQKSNAQLRDASAVAAITSLNEEI